MQLIKYIPVSLYILATCIFDIWSPKIDFEIIGATDSYVKWSVFYFTVTYLGWITHCIVEAIRTDLKYFIAMGLIMGMRLYLELNCSNLNYADYLNSINSWEAKVQLSIWTIFSLIIPMINYGKGLFNKAI